MKRTIVVILFIAALITAQSKKDFFTMCKEDSVTIFLTQQLEGNEGFIVLRKGPLPSLNYDTLNHQPVKAVQDPAPAQEILGEDWEYISKVTKSEDVHQLLRKIRSSQATSGILSLLNPSVAKLTGRWFLDPNAKKGKDFIYKIIFLDSKGKEFNSVEKQIKVISKVPVAPGNLKINELDGKAKLSWSYPKWQKSFDDITVQYFVYRKIGNETFKRINGKPILRDDNSNPGYTDYWLVNDVEYSYYVTAVDPIGRESKPSPIIKSIPKDKVPPEIPVNLSTTAGEGKVYLLWNISLELDAAGFNVFRSSGLDKKPVRLNKNIIPFDKPFYIDSLLNTGVQYFYSVSAVDKNQNESEKCNAVGIVLEDKVKPDKPGNLTAQLDKRVLKLIWKASKAKDLAGYIVYRGESKEVQPRITKSPILNLQYTDSGYTGKGLNPGVKYFISVSSVDSSNNESEKANLEILIPDDEAPFPPGNFSALNENGSFMVISFGNSPSQDVESYNLYKGVVGKKAEKLLSTKILPFKYIDTVAEKNKAYFYFATAVDSFKNESQPSRTDTILFRDYTPPPPVRNIKIISAAGGIELSWENVFDYDFAGYNVYRCLIPTGIYEKVNLELIKELKFFDKSGTKDYYYQIRSVDTSGNESDDLEPVHVGI